MKRSLPIRMPCPYGESWRDMSEEEGGRRCRRCDRHLVDLSLLTERQAERFRGLAAAALRALAGHNDTARADAFASHSRTVIPMDTVLQGSGAVQVTVRKEPR